MVNDSEYLEKEIIQFIKIHEEASYQELIQHLDASKTKIEGAIDNLRRNEKIKEHKPGTVTLQKR